MKNLNDTLYRVIQERDRADAWLKSKKITLRNPLSWIWWLFWFYRVRHVHYALNYWRTVKLLSQYYAVYQTLQKSTDKKSKV